MAGFRQQTFYTTLNILDHAAFIYGRDRAAKIESRLRELMAQYQSRLRDLPVSRPVPSSQRDVLLISYADQLSEPGKPPLRSLAEFLESYLAGVISGVHLLPFYPFSSDDGFSVIDYFSVDPPHGDWEAVARVGRMFDLMFDGVFNHISAEGKWFQRFLQDDPVYRDYFIQIEDDPDLSQVVRPRALPLLTAFQTASGVKKVWTTFSADQIDLNFATPEVMLAIMDALLFYVSRGAKFIRLDAIAYLWKQVGTPCIHLPQTHRMVQLMRSVLDEIAPGVRLITETNVPHAENISYFGDGKNEAQLVYNFALPPLALHTLRTGNASALRRWATTLRLPSDSVAFFNFLASHDGIGVTPARGLLSAREIDALVAGTVAHGGYVSYKHNPDGSKSPYELNINYFDALSDPGGDEPTALMLDRFMAAHAIMLSLRGVPGIYFHSLVGSQNDRAGAQSSGIARRINRQKLSRGALEQELAQPASLRAQVFGRHCQLLRLRREHLAFDPSSAQKIVETDERIFALIRIAPPGEEKLVSLQNVSDELVETIVPLSELRPGSSVVNLFNGDTLTLDRESNLTVTLRPYETIWAC